MQKVKAFTLAETLITLTVIGILMALMLRAINRVNPDKDKILFLKSYHALESAVTNTINDPSKYDSTFYTDDERAGMTDLHQDFRDKPYESAQITYIDNGTQKTKSNLGRSEALCYFIADQFNTLGEVSCPGNKPFRISNGVGIVVGKTDTSGNTIIYIHPQYDKGEKYQVKVFRDGKMTVPDGTGAQAVAYEWMQSQTELK